MVAFAKTNHFHAILLVVIVTMLFTACGEKKRPRAVMVPPPTIPPATERDRSQAPATPQPQPTAPDIDEYANVTPVYVETGLASWYGPPYHNRKAANGEVFDMYQLTAAHRTLPLNSVARVTNVKTGKSTMVRITDRGPFIDGRMLDLSLAAAKAIDVWRPGVATVKLEVMHAPAAIEHGGRWCVQIGAFSDIDQAERLKDKLTRRYRTAKVLQFTGPTGDWVRIRVADDDKGRAEEVARDTTTPEGSIFLVRLD